MSRVIVCVGVPSSGKTTWALDYLKTHSHTVISCRDDIRESLNLPYGDPKVEEQITKYQYADIKDCLHDGYDVIVADTNVVERFRKELVEFCLNLGAAVQIKVFPITLEEAVKRDAKREKTVGYGVIARMYRIWQNSPWVEDCVITREDKFGMDIIDKGYSV